MAEKFESYRNIEVSETLLKSWAKLKADFILAVNAEPELSKLIQNGIEKLNKSTEKLMAILDRQIYRLEFWKVTDQQINYRRFFTVNELICLRMEDEEVFKKILAIILG